MHIPKRWLYRPVIVLFQDHVENGSALDTVEVVGRLIKIEKDYLLVRSWATKPTPDKASQMEWHIVRSAVSSVVMLIPSEVT